MRINLVTGKLSSTVTSFAIQLDKYPSTSTLLKDLNKLVGKTLVDPASEQSKQQPKYIFILRSV